MPNPYEPIITNEESIAARELIIELLEKFPKGLTAREIGLQLGMTGYSISHVIRPLTGNGQVIRNSVGRNKATYTLSKVIKPAVIHNPDITSDKGVKDSRHLVVYKKDDRWVAEILVTESAAMTFAKTIADNNLGETVFYGKATRRVCTPIPKTKIEDIV